MPAHAVDHCAEELDIYQPAREQFEALLVTLQAPKTREMTQDELERLLLTEQRELMRLCLQGHLDERSKGVISSPVVDADGRLHCHQRKQRRKLETVFGTVTVSRTGFGGGGLRSLHPLDAALNLPPTHHSHTVEWFVAGNAAKESFEEVSARLGACTGADAGIDRFGDGRRLGMTKPLTPLRSLQSNLQRSTDDCLPTDNRQLATERYGLSSYSIFTSGYKF